MRLKELREAKKLRQVDLSEYLGVDRTTYVKYETGASEPGIKTLIALASFYGVTVDYLIGNDEYSVENQSNSYYALAAHHEGKMTEEAAAELQALLSSKEFLDKVNSIIDKREKKKE